MDLLPVCANGFMILLNSTHLETEVFFFPSRPVRGLGLFGTVCLILPSANKAEQTHQHRNLFTQLQSKPFYLWLGFWRRMSCVSKSQCHWSFYWFQQYWWVLSSFVLLADYMHGLYRPQLHNETSCRDKNPQTLLLPSYSLSNASEGRSELISGEAAEHPRGCLD